MEKLGIKIKLILFFSAYFPLFLILCIKNCDLFCKYSEFIHTKTFWMILIPFLISILSCFLFLLFILFLNKKSADSEYELIDYSDSASQSISYVLTYIIPFLDFNLTDRYDIICVYILLFIIGIIYVNTNMMYTNPWLYILGYSAYEVELKQGDEYQKSILLIDNKNKFSLRKSIKINTALINNNDKELQLYKGITKINKEK